MKKGFTLIELLVVVLIIGILAAIAVPYYQESVEKSIMQEAIVNLKTIAQANDVFFLQNGRYANAYEMNKLDISIAGTMPYTSYNNGNKNAIRTTNFEYRPDGDNGSPSNPSPDGYKAIAQRVPTSQRYYLYIRRNNTLSCYLLSTNNTTAAQKKLCKQIKNEGHL